MCTHRVELKAWRMVPCLVNQVLWPVYAIGTHPACEQRIRPDQKSKSAPFCHFGQDFGQRAGFGRAEMAVDKPPTSRQSARKIQRMGRALRIGEDQHRRQAAGQMLRGLACGAFELARRTGFQA